MTLSEPARKKLNELLVEACRELSIPYEPTVCKPSREDRRVYTIANALESFGEFVQQEARRG